MRVGIFTSACGPCCKHTVSDCSAGGLQPVPAKPATWLAACPREAFHRPELRVRFNDCLISAIMHTMGFWVCSASCNKDTFCEFLTVLFITIPAAVVYSFRNGFRAPPAVPTMLLGIMRAGEESV